MLPIERLQKSNTKENLWLYILSLLTRATAKRGNERSSSTTRATAKRGNERSSSTTRATAKRGNERSSSTKKKELYGWEIPKMVEKEYNFKPGRITPYRVLYRLEKDGFVKSKMKERRRIYEITKKGKRELKSAKDFYKEIFKKLG